MDESDFLNIPQPAGVLQFLTPIYRCASTGRRCTTQTLQRQSQLGLVGESAIRFPQRHPEYYGLQGSGSRYVHGGTTLQEIVVPVIEVKKLRADDIVRVEVGILPQWTANNHRTGCHYFPAKRSSRGKMPAARVACRVLFPKRVCRLATSER